MMKKNWIFVLLIGMIFITGCGQNSTAESDSFQVAGELGPQAWIDAPLNESRLPLSPYQIVFHISEQDGVSLGELSINDQVVELILNSDPSSNVATLRYVWNPSQPGKYVIRVRAQSVNGEWGDPDSAVVYIGEITVLTPTTTPSPSPQTAGISNVQAEPKQVNFGDCQPNAVTISAQAEDPAGIDVLVIFYRLRDPNGNQTGWLSEAMNPGGGDTYKKTLNMTSIVEKLGYSQTSGTFEYQLVIQNVNNEMTRSEVFRDVSVTRCAGFEVPFDFNIQPEIPYRVLSTPTVPIIK